MQTDSQMLSKIHNMRKFAIWVKLTVIAFLLSLLMPISFNSANATMNCAVLKKMTANLFKDSPNSKPQAENVWKEASQAFNKAMDLAFSNQGCYKKSEISGMRKAIKDLKMQCDKAKSDPAVWWILKGMCQSYSPSFKYAK